MSATILPFKPRRSWALVSTTPVDPVVAQALELGPGGSLAGATLPEQQAAALEANPMRRILDLECPGCWHKWIAPAAGACPSCGHEAPVCTGERVSMAQRLK